MQNAISILGLGTAGKTCILKYLATGIASTNFKPTLAVNYSTIILNKLNYRFMDVPGQARLRYLWEKCIDNLQFLIFVLDVANGSSFPEANDEFIKLLENPKTQNTPLIFLYHKMDLPAAQKNLEEAKMFFGEEIVLEYGKRTVLYLETSLNMPETLDSIKEYMTSYVSELKSCFDENADQFCED